jgi:hypothetical protein
MTPTREERMTRTRWMPRLALAVLAASLVVAARSSGALVQRERVEISAPILPDVLAIYKPFPTTLDGEKAMAHEAALTYDRLLAECAPDYPAITPPPADGSALTSAQLAANYNAVADCSYVKHTAKPYWIPKLVDDVDICGTELGAGWRLIGEDDLLALTESDFQFMQDTLTPFAASLGTSGLGPMYFGLQIWVRAHDGTIAAGSLAPGRAGARVTPFDFTKVGYTEHYEGALGLRCIRRTDLP